MKKDQKSNAGIDVGKLCRNRSSCKYLRMIISNSGNYLMCFRFLMIWEWY